MAVIPVRSFPPPSPSTVPWPIANQIGSGLICGEDIHASAPCYIGTDDLVYMCGGSGVTALTDLGAVAVGFATEDCKVAQNDAVTLVDDLDWGLFPKAGSSGAQTSSTKLYIDVSGAPKGRFASTAGITNAKHVGTVEPGGRARLYNNR